jgi:hypothetical protein
MRETGLLGIARIGGSRATAAASDHHVARSTFLNVSSLPTLSRPVVLPIDLFRAQNIQFWRTLSRRALIAADAGGATCVITLVTAIPLP